MKPVLPEAHWHKQELSSYGLSLSLYQKDVDWNNIFEDMLYIGTVWNKCVIEWMIIKHIHVTAIQVKEQSTAVTWKVPHVCSWSYFLPFCLKKTTVLTWT